MPHSEHCVMSGILLTSSLIKCGKISFFFYFYMIFEAVLLDVFLVIDVIARQMQPCAQHHKAALQTTVSYRKASELWM